MCAFERSFMEHKNYDTLLFGNGLTIALFNKINEKTQVEDFNSFFEKFLFLSFTDKKEFYKILYSNKDSDVYLEANDIKKIEAFLIENLDSIISNGFEVWIGEKAFTANASLVKDTACYYLALFNYWFNLLDLSNCAICESINLCANSFKKLGITDIYTLNYDTFLDKAFEIKHIHGSFLDSFYDLLQMAYFRYKNNFNVTEFLYPFCAETNGFAKLSALYRLYNSNVAGYNYSFLFSTNESYGNLLIYGIRFADSLIIPDIIKSKYTNKDIRLMQYVDGHIILRLEALYNANKIDSITIAYYSDKDLERYKRVLKKCEFYKIVKYVKSSDIF